MHKKPATKPLTEYTIHNRDGNILAIVVVQKDLQQAREEMVQGLGEAALVLTGINGKIEAFLLDAVGYISLDAIPQDEEGYGNQS